MLAHCRYVYVALSCQTVESQSVNLEPVEGSTVHLSTSRVHRFFLATSANARGVQWVKSTTDTTTPHCHMNVLTAVKPTNVVSCPMQCCRVLAQARCLPLAQVRFGWLHSEIERNGGRGAEQEDGEAHDTIGLLGTFTGCSGMNWHEMWSQWKKRWETSLPGSTRVN